MTERFAIVKKKLYEEVIEQIAKLVDTREYHVGDRLPSLQELSDMFGVGKPTLREALSVLAATGVLEIKHGSGIYLRRLAVEPEYTILAQLGNLESEKLLHWVEFRRAMEVEAAGLAAERSSSKDIARLKEIHAQLEEGIRKGNVLGELDYQFHQQIALATKNPIFVQVSVTNAQILQSYFELSLRQSLAMQARRELVILEHMQILVAIEKGQAREARLAMLLHIDNVKRKIELLRDHGENDV